MPNLAPSSSVLDSLNTPNSTSIIFLYSPIPSLHTHHNLNTSISSLDIPTSSTETTTSTPISTDPAPNPPPTVSSSLPTQTTSSTHPMITHSHHGIVKHVRKLNILTQSILSTPRNYLQAINDPNWLNSMMDEFNALISIKTWVLVPKPANANIVNFIWLFKKKEHADGSLVRYKARLVANGRS